MNDSFFDYLHRLELIAFFSGYPLLYATVLLISGNRRQRNNIKQTLVSSLSYSYALIATLYVGFELSNILPNYSINNLKHFAPHPLFVAWGMLAIFFWIPVFVKRPFLTFLHSLVFFFLLVQDLFFAEAVSPGSRETIRNDMKLYTASMLLNCVAFITVALIYFLFRWLKVSVKSSRLFQ